MQRGFFYPREKTFFPAETLSRLPATTPRHATRRILLIGSDTTINVEHIFNPYDTTVTFDSDLGCETSFYEKYFSITIGGFQCNIDNTVDISNTRGDIY